MKKKKVIIVTPRRLITSKKKSITASMDWIRFCSLAPTLQGSGCRPGRSTDRKPPVTAAGWKKRTRKRTSNREEQGLGLCQTWVAF